MELERDVKRSEITNLYRKYESIFTNSLNIKELKKYCMHLVQDWRILGWRIVSALQYEKRVTKRRQALNNAKLYIRWTKKVITLIIIAIRKSLNLLKSEISDDPLSYFEELGQFSNLTFLNTKQGHLLYIYEHIETMKEYLSKEE